MKQNINLYKMNILNNFKIIVLIIIFLFNFNGYSQSEIIKAKKEIIEATKIMNKNLPLRIDDITIAAMVNYNEVENELAFFFNITDLSNLDTSEKGIEKFINEGKISGVEFIRNNPLNKNFLLAQLDFVYIYFDNNKKVILKYKIRPYDYN